MILQMALLACLASPPDAAGWAAHVETLAAAEGAEAALRLAAGFGRRGERATALRWAAEAEQRGAQQLRVEIVRGDAAMVAGDWIGAINAYFEVSRRAPLMAYTQVQLWHCLRQAPPESLAAVDVTRVRTYLKRAGYFVPIQFHADFERTRSNAATERGFEALRRGDAAQSIRAFHEAITLWPTLPEAWRGLGAAEVQAAHPNETRAAYEIFLSLSPTEGQDTRRIRRILTDDARRRGLGVPTR